MILEETEIANCEGKIRLQPSNMQISNEASETKKLEKGQVKNLFLRSPL